MSIFERIGSIFTLFFHMLHVTFQLLYGFWRISTLEKPIVSIFGSARLKEDQIYFKQAHDLAQRFVAHGISVLAGGGPGIMEAVSCGGIVHESVNGAKSIGIGVKGLGEKRSLCVQEYFELDYFFARKWLLTQYSTAFIVFPGGFGTLDELAEILTLMQTKQMSHAPIILIGTEFWAPFMQWITQEALAHALVSQDDIALFTVTDNMEQAFCVVRDRCDIV
jgi:uncharacterized protein (TIGR00730 family)